MLLWALYGCGRDARDVKQVVTELCKWGQLSELQPSALPPELDLAQRVRESDLRYAKAEFLEPSQENPFLAAQQKVGLVADGPAKALARAVANRATCEVTVTVDGDTATAHVKRVAPRPLKDEDLYVKVAELQKLPTLEEQVAKIEEWIRAAPDKVETTEYDLKADRLGDHWVADFGLAESRIAADQATLDQANATIAEGRKAEQDLAKVVIVGTDWFEHASSKSSAPRVDVTARNDTGGRISKVMLHGVLTSPDHEGPWFDDVLTHVPLDRFEAGDTQTWTIVSRLPGKWRVRAPDDAQLQIEVLKMWAPGDKLLADKTELDDALQTAEKMTAEIARLKAAYVDLQTQVADAPAR
jgi:hypothetical protein